MLYLTLFITGSAIESQQNDPTTQNSIALTIIKSMQECIDFDKKAQLQMNDSLNTALIQEQSSLWKKAVELYHTYISELREKHINGNRPTLTIHSINSENIQQQLIMQMNEHKFTFENLLNEYIIHLGQLYEKKIRPIWRI